MIDSSPTASEPDFQKFLIHLVRQFAVAIAVLFAVSLITFIASRAAPGDPRELILDPYSTHDEFDRLAEELGLDKPIVQQYFIFIGNALTLDFGDSIREERPATDVILDRLPSTIYLALAVLPVSLAVGILLGWLASQTRGRASGIWFRAVTGFIESMPSFWLGLMLLLIFAVNLDLFPASGRGGWQSFILPVLTLSPLFAVAFARLTRSILLPETAAGGKGFPPWGSASSTGINFSLLLIAWMTVEVVFAWPGLGNLMLAATYARDWPLMEGVVIFLALWYVFLGFIVEALFFLLKSLSAQIQSPSRPQQGAGAFAEIPSDVSHLPEQPDGALPVNGSLRFLCLAPALVLGLLILVALAAPLIAPYDHDQGYLENRISPPGTGADGTSHIMGTDRVGRDVFSRIIHGFRNALVVSALVLAAAAIPGVIIALLAAQFAGWTDKILTFLADIELPPVLTAAALVLALGPSMLMLFIALWLWALPYCVRLVRDAAFPFQTAHGLSVQQPAALIVSVLAAVVSLTGMIVLAETTLSFLGVGVPRPAPAWGIMAADGRQYLITGWWVSVFPGLAIVLTLLTLNFTAVGLRGLFHRP